MCGVFGAGDRFGVDIAMLSIRTVRNGRAFVGNRIDDSRDKKVSVRIFWFGKITRP